MYSSLRIFLTIRGVLYYPCSMVLGQFFCRFTRSAAQTHCARHARHPQLVSKKFLEEEIFAGTNFRELAFDRENCKNFCLVKISRYTVSHYHHACGTRQACSTVLLHMLQPPCIRHRQLCSTAHASADATSATSFVKPFNLHSKCQQGEG